MKEFKKRLSLLLASILLVTTIMPQTIHATDYDGHWASKAIAKWQDKGIVKGYEDGTFRPKNQVTRAEFASFLVRVFGYSATGQMTYTDVKEEAWYIDSIKRIANQAIMNDSGDKFRPEDPVTREEAAYALANAYKITGSSDKTFSDQDQISAWAVENFEAMLANDLIKGMPNGQLAPKSTLTRAELVAMLDRMTQDIVNTAGDYSQDTAGNLVVNTRDVVLKDMTIEGNLYLGEGIGDGDVTLENIQVKGQVIVEGGGINSIKSKNSTYYETFILKTKDPVRILIEGDAVRVEAQPGTNVILSGNFSEVIVSPDVNMTVRDATLETIIVAPAKNPEAKLEAPAINIEGTSKVETIKADAPVEVKGTGKVENLQVNTQGVKIEQTPAKVEMAESLDKDTTVNIGGKEQNKDSVSKPDSKPSDNNSGGSGGGSGGGSSHVCDSNKKIELRGRVTADGKAVAYATVRIDKKSDNSMVASTLTDKDGYYSIYLPACKTYTVEAWVNTDNGYGYHQKLNNLATMHTNTIVDITLIQRHVVNFKVEDKNGAPIMGVVIVPFVNGQQEGWSWTDRNGEETRYLWNEEATYDFKIYLDLEAYEKDLPNLENPIHELEDIKINDQYKQNIKIVIEEVGLSQTIKGRVVPLTDSESIEGTEVHLLKKVSESSFKRVETSEINANGEYEFKIEKDELEVEFRIYAEKVDFKEGINGAYYESNTIDARDAKDQDLKLKRSYNAIAYLVDGDGNPIVNEEVKIEILEHTWMGNVKTGSKGRVNINGHSIKPGKHTLNVTLGGTTHSHQFEFVEGVYDYVAEFVFESYQPKEEPEKFLLSGEITLENNVTAESSLISPVDVKVYEKGQRDKTVLNFDLENPDENGIYRFSGMELAEGDYDLVASVEVDGNEYFVEKDLSMTESQKVQLHLVILKQD